MLLLNAANHDSLLSTERPVDLDLIAGANSAVRLRRLPIHRNLAALAGFLRFGSRPKETRDVQPDVEADVCNYLQIRSLPRASNSAKLMAQIMTTNPQKIIASVVSAEVSQDLALRCFSYDIVAALARTKSMLQN